MRLLDRTLMDKGKTMKVIFALCLIALTGGLVGCAITSSYKHGPNGGEVHMIDGMSAGVAYRKADQLCPNGYNIIAQQGQTSVMDYMMTVECKTAQAASVAVPQQAAPVASSTPNSRVFSSAQNVAAGQYCDRAIKSLFRQGDREMFEASGCPDGHPIQIDCQGDTCRMLQSVQ